MLDNRNLDGYLRLALLWVDILAFLLQAFLINFIFLNDFLIIPFYSLPFLLSEARQKGKTFHKNSINKNRTAEAVLLLFLEGVYNEEIILFQKHFCQDHRWDKPNHRECLQKECRVRCRYQDRQLRDHKRNRKDKRVS